jgi:hypothetical protein
MRWVLVMLMGMLLASAAGVQEQGPRFRAAGDAIRFETVDVFVDSGPSPLGAWQVQIKALAGDVKLVGIEGGDGVYKDPPYYDAAALHEDQIRDRIIIAAFSTGPDLPTGKARVARLHVQVSGGGAEYSVKLMTAGSADGTKIEAKAMIAGDGR